MMTAIKAKDRELLACSSYREFLSLELNNRKEKNSCYSLRAMARDLEISASILSTILQGKNRFSEATVRRIAAKLQKPEPIADYFLYLALAEIQAPGEIYNLNFQKAREIRLRYLYTPIDAPHRTVDGWSLAALALTVLLRIEDELRSDEVLCRRLNIPVDQLRQLIDELKALGWLEQTEDGPTCRMRYLELGASTGSYHIRSIHKKTIERALWSLDHLPPEQRHFYNTFFTMDPARAEMIAEKLRSYALSLTEDELPPRPGQEVYTIGAYLVPLTLSAQPCERLI